MLKDWTKSTSFNLPDSARTLFQFLCHLEDADRLKWIVSQVWPQLWKGLNLEGDVPALEQALTAVKSAGLVEPHALGKQVSYQIHPGVAQAGLEEADEKLQAAVDTEMASFWRDIFATAGSGQAEEMGQRVIMAGLRSAPYLMRQKRWDEASILIHHALKRDRSPETVASVLPLLRHIVQSTSEPDNSGILANALLKAGHWKEAEDILKSLLPMFIAQDNFRSASAAAGDLFNILWHTGRIEEALKLAEEMKDYCCQTGFGPWTQLAPEVKRLQAMTSLERWEEVMQAVDDLRKRMKALPGKSDLEEAADTWNIREGILDCGVKAALRLGKYEKALELNAEMIDSQISRKATELQQATTCFNGCYALLGLKRYDQALKLIIACREVFERERSVDMLSCVFTALAIWANRLGQKDQGISFGKTALLYSYLFGDPEKISNNHYNLAIFFRENDSQSALDHRLAATVILIQISSVFLASCLGDLARDLDKFGHEALPESFDQLCDRVEEVEGVQFRELWARLPKRAKDGDQLLKEIIEAAKAQSQKKSEN